MALGHRSRHPILDYRATELLQDALLRIALEEATVYRLGSEQ